MSLWGVVGVEDLLLLASRGGSLLCLDGRDHGGGHNIREEVACRVGPVRNECEDLGYESLLDACVLV